MHPSTPAPCLSASSAHIESVYAVIEDVIRRVGPHPAFVSALRQRVRPPDGPHWLHLPLLCCQAAGGDPDQGVVVAAAFELARLAADVLDDVEDADVGGSLWQSMSIPQAINVGTGLIFASLMALSRLREHGAALETVAALQTEFARTGFRMCAGQHLDLQGGTGAWEQGSKSETCAEPSRSIRNAALSLSKGPERRPERRPESVEGLAEGSEIQRYWQIVAAKSGAFFELGCRAGALLGDVAEEDTTPYAEYGRHLGLLIQIANDLAGLLDEDGSSDLIHRKPTLPVIYAFSVAPEPQAEQLRRAWTAGAHDAQARREVRRLVIELGAPQYVFVEAERHYRRARQALEQTGGQPDALDQLAEILKLHRPVSFLSTKALDDMTK